MPAPAIRLPRRLIYVVSSLFLAALAVHFLGIALLAHFVERGLHPAAPHGTSFGATQLNLFTGWLEVRDFELRTAGRPRIRIGRLDVKIDPWRLLRGHLHVTRAEISRVRVEMDRRTDGSFDVGLPVADDNAPAASAPMPFSLAGASVDRVTVIYHDGDWRTELRLHTMHIGAYRAQAPEQRVPIDLALDWQGDPLRLAGEIILGPDGVGGRFTLDLEQDLARPLLLARQPARLQGRAAFAGELEWQAQHLQLSGKLDLHGMAFVSDDGQLGLARASLPALRLDVVLGDTLQATFDLAQPARLTALVLEQPDLVVRLGAADLSGQARLGADQVIALSTPTLQLSDLIIEQRALPLTASIQHARLDLGDTTLRAAAAADGDLTFTGARVDLSATGIALRLPGTIDALKLGQVTLATAELTGKSAGSQMTAGPTKLHLAGLQLALDEYAQRHLSIDQGSLDADTLMLTDHTMQGSVGVGLQGIAWVAPDFPPPGLSVGRLAVDQAELAELIQLSGVQIADLAVTGGADTGLRLRLAAVDRLQLHPGEALALGNLTVDGLDIAVARDGDGHWQLPVALAGTDTQQTPATGGSDDSLAWRIDGIAFGADNAVHWHDRSLSPKVAHEIAIARLQLGAIDSRQTDIDTPLDLQLKLDRYSTLTFKGTLRPLATPVYLNAEGELAGFSLDTLNSFIADSIGHGFRNGLIDDRYTIRIADNALDMHNQINLADLEVEPIEGKKGPPLGMAIALLQDRQGRIKLDLPVAGKLDDPNFQIQGVLNPVILKAVAGGAALAIQPLGSVLLVGSLLADAALEVKFEPALFVANGTELNAKTPAYLTQLAAKLGDLPKLRLRLCGQATAADRTLDKKGNPVETDAQLLALADTRADQIRERLVALGVEGERLRSCRPKIDPVPEAQPRVDIRF